MTALAAVDPAWDRWWERAACKDTPTDMFYPPDPDEVPFEARRVCEDCPVRQPCLDHSLRHELYGVWAGLSSAARERLRRTLRIRLSSPETEAPPPVRGR